VNPNIVHFPPPAAPFAGDVLTGSPELAVKPLTVWTPDQLLAWVPPADAVILGEPTRGYIVREELTVFIGPPGVGKSRLILWLAICTIIGRPFAELPTQAKGTKWLLIGNENSRSRLRHDLERMIASLTTEETALVRANLRLHILNEPRDGFLDLGDRDAREAIAATLREHAPDCVAFDPWANLVGGDENKNQDVRDSVRHLLGIVRLNAPRAACIVVHHARTGSGTVAQAGNRFNGASLSRGGKALPSAARCEIAVWPGDADDEKRLAVTCEKCNNAPVFAPRGLLLDPESMTYDIDPDFSVEAWRDDVEGKRRNHSASVADVVRAVREACPLPGESVKAAQIVQSVKDATGASQRTIKTRIAEGVKSSYLRALKPSGNYALGSKPFKG